MFFITFTCHKWIALIEETNSYDLVYNWFDLLKTKGHFINGFVIMPNHVHALITFKETKQSINTIVGNGKRFMAYEIIERLKKMGRISLLSRLHHNIEKPRRLAGKLHNVWELSFNWKYCTDEKFILQKLNYIHNNPCRGKWTLCEKPIDYAHSSARQYFHGEIANYEVVLYNFMRDEKLTDTF